MARESRSLRASSWSKGTGWFVVGAALLTSSVSPRSMASDAAVGYQLPAERSEGTLGFALPPEYVEPPITAAFDPAPYCETEITAGTSMPARGIPRPDAVWTRIVGSAAPDGARAVALMPGDGLAVALQVQGDLYIDHHEHLGEGLSDTAVIAFDAAGEFRWMRELATTNGELPEAMVALPNGDLVVAGSFHNELIVDERLLRSAGQRDVFIIRLDSTDGAVQWATSLGGRLGDTVTAMALSPSGEVVLAGYFREALSLGQGNAQLRSAGGSDAMLVALSPDDGEVRWGRRFGGAGEDRAYGIAIDDRGHVYAAGMFSAELRIGARVMRSAGQADALVVEFGSDHDVRWARGFGDERLDIAKRVAVDQRGDVYVAGEFRGQFSAGGDTFDSPNDKWDGFVAKLSGETGDHVWSKAYGNVWSEKAWGLTVSGDELILAASVGKEVDLGSGPIAEIGGIDVLVVSLRSCDGAPYWHHRWGGREDDLPAAVAVSAKRIAVVGLAGGPTNLDGEPLAWSGCADAFVTVLGR